ncbi:MAG: hypothetical protein ACR2K2_12110 [Mycobacteriales bacterium]
MAGRGESPRLDVSAWDLLGQEPSGLSEHPWLRRPGDEQLWLWKPVEVKAGNRQGEDWAEKVVSEIGLRLSVPCARVELARRSERDGSISRDIKPRGWDLQPGAALLDGHVEGYESKTKYRSGHSLDNVHEVLTDLRPPPDAPAVSGLSAYDVFCGYLVLDALVANSDRHDHNWAVVLPPTLQDERPALAASYDHASSLGFNLRDERRDRFVAEGTVSRFAGRGVARRFEHAPPPTSIETLVGLARRALLRATAEARSHWMTALMTLDLDRDVSDVVHSTAGMSASARRFAIELLTTNRERLLAPDDREDAV